MPDKNDLIQSLIKKVALSKRQAVESLNTVFDEITKSLSKGEAVKITGFGKFLVKESRGRKLPKFKAGQVLKDAVR